MKNLLLGICVLLLLTISSQLALAQIKYRVGLDADKVTYRVYMTSTTSYTSNSARISTAQVTLRVPHATGANSFSVGNLQGKVVASTQMLWSLNARVNAPTESPTIDYLSFGFSGSASPILFDIPANQEIELFSFQNTGPCLGIVTLFENDTDPFKTPNSQSTNPGNQITVLGHGPGNAYIGNYGTGASCSTTADLSTIVSVDNQAPNRYDAVTATIVVTNSGPDSATGVISKVGLPAGQPITSATATAGSFASGTGLWTIGTLTSGQSVTLTVVLSAATEGIASIENEITASGQYDPDSTPNNQVDGEDDLARTCFSVPVELCDGETFDASIPGTFTNVQWYKNGTPIQGATGNTLTIGQAGTYTVVTNVTCPANGCCPIIVRIKPPGSCCVATACVPFTIKRTR